MYGNVEPFITTFSGKELTFLSPEEDQIELDDICNNLSKICRFNGNIKHFYSVAEHCVLLAQKVLEETGDTEQALTALMHDASEAYLCDIPRPIKPHLDNYMELEEQLQNVIFSKFNIDPMNDLIAYYDHHIVADEAKVLFKTPPKWVDNFEEVGVELMLLTSEQAEHAFREFYNFLNSDKL